MQKLKAIWPYLMVFNIIILVLRYIYQFAWVNVYIEEKTEDTWVDLDDFGFDNKLNWWKFIGNAMILCTLNIQRVLFLGNFREKYDDYKKRKHEKDKFLMRHKTLPFYWDLTVNLTFSMIFYHISKVLLWVTFFIALYHANLIGLFYLIFLIMVLLAE